MCSGGEKILCMKSCLIVNKITRTDLFDRLVGFFPPEMTQPSGSKPHLYYPPIGHTYSRLGSEK